MPNQTEQLEVQLTPDTWVEAVYVATDGEFLREVWVLRNHGALSEVVARPLLSDEELQCIFAADPQDRDTLLRTMAEQREVSVKQYFVNKYFSNGKAATNLEIVNSLRLHGFPKPRRFPAVEVYVDPCQEYTADRIKPEAQRYGRKWCHLTTNGDAADLRAFAARLGLNTTYIQHEGRATVHFDLTPKRRERAVAAGAIELTHEQAAKKTREAIRAYQFAKDNGPKRVNLPGGVDGPTE